MVMPSREHTPAEVDLLADAAAELDDYREEVVDALTMLHGSIKKAVMHLREALASVEIVGDRGDVDCALAALDKAVTGALNAARLDLGA